MADTTVLDPVQPETAEPRYKGPMRKRSTQDILDAYKLSEASGMGNADRLAKILGRRDVDPAAGEASFDVGDPSEANFQDTLGTLRNSGGKDSRKSALITKWEGYKADLLKKKLDDYFDTNIQPTFTTVNDTLKELLANPSFSAEELGMRRSEMTSQIRAQEASRLKRLSAGLGLSGIDPGSVAGAALANSVAEDADRELTDNLRRFGLDVMQFERENQARELGLSTQLSTTMLGAKTALESGNFDRIYGINSELAGILEAVRQQQEAEAAQRDANKTAFKQSLITSGIGAVGSIAGGILSSGASGTGGLGRPQPSGSSYWSPNFMDLG